MNTASSPACASPPLPGRRMKLLMVDNYDSFTYNIVQYFGELGAEVEVFRNDEITVAEIEARLNAGKLDRLVISPGPCSPAEAKHLGGCDQALCGQAAHPGCVFGPPEHWRSVWRQHHPRARADAWQNQRHHHHAKGRVCRIA